MKYYTIRRRRLGISEKTILLIVCTAVLVISIFPAQADGAGSLRIDVPNGQLYPNDGDFVITAFTVSTTATANFVTMNCLDDDVDPGSETFEVAITTDSQGNNVIASAQITNNFEQTGGCDDHRYSFDFIDCVLTGGQTYYLRTKVLAGALVRAWGGATLYYDGGLPPYNKQSIPVPIGHIYPNDGSTDITSFSVPTDARAHFVTMRCLIDHDNDPGGETFEVSITTDSEGNDVIAAAQITNNFGVSDDPDGHMYLFDFRDVILEGGTTYYLKTRVLSGAPVENWGYDQNYLYYTEPAPGSVDISVPDGHMLLDNGDYVVTQFTLGTTIMANYVTMNCLEDVIYNDPDAETVEVSITADPGGTLVLATAQITNNFGQYNGDDGHMYSFDFGDVQLTGGVSGISYYLRTTVLAGAPVRTYNGATLYHSNGWPAYDQIVIPMSDPTTYSSDGDFIVTPFQTTVPGVAHFVTMRCLDDTYNDYGIETFEVAITDDSLGNNVIASAQITNNFRKTGGCDERMYLFDFPDVLLLGGMTYYVKTTGISGTPIMSWNWSSNRNWLYYTPKPQCSIHPSSLDFGTATLGNPVEKDFTITNVGGGTLETTVSESCDHYEIVGGEQSFSLGYNESSPPITVRFTPTTSGQHDCVIETGNDSLCSDVPCTGYAYYYFVHITDTHVGTTGGEERFDYVIDKINNLSPKPDFIVMSGDMVHHGGHWQSWTALNNVLDRLDESIGYYHCVGNHEYYNFLGFLEGPPEDEPSLSGYFENKELTPRDDLHLISTSSGKNKDVFEVLLGYIPGIAMIPIWRIDWLPEAAGLSDSRYSWLTGIINNCPGSNKILFMHHPVVCDYSRQQYGGEEESNGCITENRTNLMNLCRDENVKVVLGGHTHEAFEYMVNQQNTLIHMPEPPNGYSWSSYDAEYLPMYIITDGCGEDLGYRRIEVHGDEVRVWENQHFNSTKKLAKYKFRAHPAIPLGVGSLASTAEDDSTYFSAGRLHAYDSQGNHVGLNSITGEIDFEIDMAYYEKGIVVADTTDSLFWIGEEVISLLVDPYETYTFEFESLMPCTLQVAGHVIEQNNEGASATTYSDIIVSEGATANLHISDNTVDSTFYLHENGETILILPDVPVTLYAEGKHLFQDNFASDGTTTGTVRADMAADIMPSISPNIRPGDSVVVEINDPEFELDVDQYTGFGPSVYCYVSVSQPSIPMMRGAAQAGKSGSAQTGKGGTALSEDMFRFPVVDSLYHKGKRWYFVRMDTVFTDSNSRTGFRRHRYCIDLNDNLFTPGDTVYFVFAAKSNTGEMTYWSEFTGKTESLSQVLESPMEFTCLPANALDPSNSILYVNACPDDHAQPFFETAWEQMDIYPDRFDKRVPRLKVANGLGSRIIDPVEQLSIPYKMIIWNTGDLSGATIGDGDNDKSNDFNVLFDFLDQHLTDGACVYLSGNDIANEWSTLTSADAINFKSLYMSHNLLSSSHVDMGIDRFPLVIGELGSCFDHGYITDSMYVYPDQGDLDVLEPADSAVVEMTYGGDPLFGAVLRQQTVNSVGSTVNVMLSGFSFHYIRDDAVNPYQILDRVHHMHDILLCFGNFVDPPIAAETKPVYINNLGQNYPNPFNPVTTINYSIANNCKVELKIFDVSGALVRTLVNENKRANNYRVTWDGRNNSGNSVASGVYFYRLIAGDFRATKKMVLLR